MKRALIAVAVAVLAAALIPVGGAGAEDDLRVSERPYLCDEGREGQYETFVYAGYVMFGQHCGGGAEFVRKLDGAAVGVDERTPGVVFDPNRLGDVVGVYEGDRVGSRPLAGGPPRPLENQRVDEVVYTANSSHRAVRGTDGQCYREYRSGGRWLRSGAYGTTAEACRRAAWNAYDRSRNAPLRSVHEPPPAGDPPGR